MKALFRRLRLVGILCTFWLIASLGCGRSEPSLRGGPIEEVLAKRRPGEGRLAGVAWGEPQPAGPYQVTDPGFQAIAVRAARAVERSRTASTLWDHAGVLLAAGQTDRAVAELSEAAHLDPRNAAVWNDLAVALLQRSQVHSDPYDIVLALSAANRAVQLASPFPAARFNRALALERLSLYEEARAEWELVLRGERDRSWAREARANTTALARVVDAPDREALLEAARQAAKRGNREEVHKRVSEAPQLFREHVEGILLPGWGRKYADGDPASEDLLDQAREIAVALASVNGERLAADTITQIDQAGTHDPMQRQRLALGLAEYSDGLVRLREEGNQRALSHFQAAQEVLEEQGSPFAGWAIYQAAVCLYQLPRYLQAHALWSRIAEDPTLRRYTALRSQAVRMIGVINSIQGRPTAALSAFDSALAGFRKLKEKAHVARLEGLIAVELNALGQSKEAWRRIYLSLIEPETHYQPKIRSSICGIAALIVREQGEAEIALLFQDQVVRNAFSASALVEALRARASLLADLDRRNEASRDLARARLEMEQLPKESRKILEGDLLLAEADLAGSNSPQEVLATLDKAIPILRETTYHYLLAQVLYQRAKAYIALGRTDAAERDLADALEEFERQREAIAPPEERVLFFDRSREILDALMTLQLARGRPELALYYSEHGKARVLWDWMLARPADGRPEAPPGPPDLPALLRNLPAETAVLYYAVLPETTVVWLLRRGREPESRNIPIGERALSELVEALHRSVLAGSTPDIKAKSAQLYALLIAPVESALRDRERLVLIPDRALHRLSFALLWNGSGRYLVQDHILAVTPSLRVFEASRRRKAELGGGSRPQALVVTDPAFDRELYPSLPRLSARSTEEAIARIFPGSRSLQGEGATPRAFLRMVGDFEIVHFGGHSMVHPELPLLSQMLFAAEPGDLERGVLYSGDILHQRFRRTRLAVLASCSTAQGRLSHTEGVENLARPFLAIGIPTVVASLWNVEDVTTSDLFARFYAHLQPDFDAAAALQAVQIEAIEHGRGEMREVRSWGAFEVID